MRQRNMLICTGRFGTIRLEAERFFANAILVGGSLSDRCAPNGLPVVKKEHRRRAERATQRPESRSLSMLANELFSFHRSEPYRNDRRPFASVRRKKRGYSATGRLR